MTVQAGRLRRRVTLQRPVQAQDAAGGAIVSAWEDFATNIPAEIAPISGRELFVAQQVQSNVNFKILIRWRPGVTTTMRVAHVTDEVTQAFEVFDIEAVLPDATGREWLTLLCIQREAEGFRSG